MPCPNRFLSTLVAALVAGGCLAACSAETGPSSGESLGQTDEALTTCTSGGCCVGGATPFNTSDPLQAQLSAWHCTQPKVYSPNQATGAWWYWSMCSDPSQRVENFLKSHPAVTAAPDSAVATTSLNPACAPAPPAGWVDVLWDPTCTTCTFK